MAKDLHYRTTAIARCGDAASVEAGALRANLSTPEELGGSGGDGTNAEQLLAAGYAACLLAALRYVAAQRGQKLSSDVQVTATVEIAQDHDGRFDLSVSLEANGDGEASFDELLEEAQRIWPYSGTLIGGGPITINGAGGSAGSDDPVGVAREQAATGRGYGG